MLVLALVALGGWFATRPAPGPASSAPDAVAAAPVPQPVPAPAAPTQPETPAVPEPVAAPEPIAAPTAPAATPGKQSARPSASESVPEEARALLDKAESALKGGNAEEAIDLARRSQLVKVTPASFSVLTRAYCHRNDIGGAKGKWREGKPQMSAKERTRVKAFCDKHDIPL